LPEAPIVSEGAEPGPPLIPLKMATGMPPLALTTTVSVTTKAEELVVVKLLVQ
jgi:hypothetical protein